MSNKNHVIAPRGLSRSSERNINEGIAGPVGAKQSGSSEIASSLPEEGTVKGILMSPDAADVRASSSPLGTPRNDRLTHLDPNGAARMVNVTGKIPTQRIALAGCEILMKPETLDLLKSGQIEKGDAFTVSKIAGIMAAKKTHETIPLCHPLPLEAIDIHFRDDLSRGSVSIECCVETTAKTGVEMEALHGVMIAALTLYDMAKAHDPGMIISNLRLIQKTGGKSDYSA